MRSTFLLPARVRQAVMAGVLTALLAIPAGTASAQEAAAKAEAKVDTTPRKLFRSQDPVTMTITVDLKKLVRMRERQSAPLTARLVYDAGAQGADTLLVAVGTRGNFRLSGRNCNFPPIRLFFTKDEVKGSIFEHQKELKLVTRCQTDDKEYEQYILQEEPIYRIYNMLTPYSMRTRLVKVTYADTLKKEKPVTTWAFLVEESDAVARRVGGKPFTAKRAVFDDVEAKHMRIIGFFEYMIANTDWSLGALHNMKLIRSPDGFTVFPMAYDFDWSGVINPRYANPDPQLPIRTVRERLYRGPCITNDVEITEIASEFLKRKDAIYALYDKQVDLAPALVKQTKEYYDEFFKIIASPKKVRDEMMRTCQELGN